jgi:hypothetical protein
MGPQRQGTGLARGIRRGWIVLLSPIRLRLGRTRDNPPLGGFINLSEIYEMNVGPRALRRQQRSDCWFHSDRLHTYLYKT